MWRLGKGHHFRAITSFKDVPSPSKFLNDGEFMTRTSAWQPVGDVQEVPEESPLSLWGMLWLVVLLAAVGVLILGLHYLATEYPLAPVVRGMLP